MTPGTKLGHYEIVERIGAGGMGEVFRARDSRLGRDVAIKIAAQQFSERFEREARLIASLNHPNICTLHDVGPNYLVMELVEGPTLAERIASGAIPVEESIHIATQMAAALEAAHEKGIVHRDFKPGNVKIKPDGTVKVLDFGLAKAGGTPTADQAEDSPTLSMAATQAGVILGTAAYMAPEQARGKPLDKRADIWAFGVVLYEMVTGWRLFRGETITDTLAAVIEREPDWDRVPARMRPLLRGCLKKDPKQRLHDIADAKLLLEQVPSPTETPVAIQPRQSWLWPGVAALFVVTTALLAFIHFRETPPPPPEPVRFGIPAPSNASFSFTGVFAVSPDGRKVVFGAASSDGTQSLWLRALDSLEAHPLPDTTLTNTNPPPPFWSADSRFVAFVTDGKLKKIDVTGGPALTICDLGAIAQGGSWNKDGVIIFGNSTGPLMRVSDKGGVPTAIAVLDSGRKEIEHRFPTFLPDGKHFVYLRISASEEESGIYLGSLDAKPEEQNSKRLMQNGLAPGFSASTDPNRGQLLFMRGNTLLAQPFDLQKMDLSGDASPVAEQVATPVQIDGLALFSTSANGVLVYRTGVTQGLQPTWYDRAGKVISTVGEPGRYGFLSLSPDDSRAAVLQDGDVWLLDFARGTNTRLTIDKAASSTPIWSPDGTRIAYYANRGNEKGIYARAANGTGTEELLLKGNRLLFPNHWSPDGRFLIYGEQDAKTKNDLWVLPFSSGKPEEKPIPFLTAPFNETGGRFSPDAHWIAYTSDESGKREIYIQSFDPSTSSAGAKTMVSKGAAGMVRWRADTKEFFYLAPDGKIMSVDITTKPTFHAGLPVALFQVPPIFLRSSNFPGSLADVSADGKKFLFAMPAVQNTREELTVVLNWTNGAKGGH